MSTSTEHARNEKQGKGGARRAASAATDAPDKRPAGERTSTPPATGPDPGRRSWGEKHGGTLVIGIVFAVLVLLVLVKQACP